MAKQQILRSLRRVTPTQGSKRRQPMRYQQREIRGDLLLQAQEYWDAMYKFRAERERNKRYLYGDQWSDMTYYDGKWMTEAEYISRQGNVPLKNNLTRRLVRNAKGYYANLNTEPTCVARERKEQKAAQNCGELLHYNMQLNCLSELRSIEVEEFFTSALVAERHWWGWQNDKFDVWTRMVSPNNFIIDANMSDPRGWDCSFVGELHDISFEQLASTFARSSADYERLSNIYAGVASREQFCARWVDFGYNRDRLHDFDFFLAADNGRCRVIEVWRKENKPRLRCHDWNTGEVFKVEISDRQQLVDAPNAERLAMAAAVGMTPEDVPLITADWFIDEYWHYYFLSPFGDVLDAGETPFAHKSHPYVFKAYPFIDGEIHSFVADVIDQQRYINRLIIMNDMAVRSAAKGLMMIPIECIPDGMDYKKFAESCTVYNGILFYKSRNVQHTPSVITSNSTNIGTTELLKLQLQFMEDISGIHGALQGQTPASGTSGTLYAQQTQNATTSLVDLVQAFQAFEREAAYKDLKTIQQYYDDRKIYNIIGDELGIDITPDKIRNVEADISVAESTATPAYRDMANQFLLQLWQAGQLNVEQLLEHGDFPHADELLQSLQAQREEMEKAQAMQGGQAMQPQTQPQGGQAMQTQGEQAVNNLANQQ